MALDKYDHDDALLGRAIATGNRTAFVPAFVQVDSTGAEIPFSGTALAASSGNKANAVATATLTATANVTNYLTGFDITFAGATAASVVLATVTGLLGGTQTFVITVPAGAAVAGTPLTVSVNPPHPASGTNTAISVSLPALGAGNTNACVNARGIQK